MKKRGKGWQYVEITLAMIFWSASFVWYKEAFQTLTPITLIFLRMIIATVFLFVIIRLMRRHERIRRSDIRLFLLLGFVEPFLYFVGESLGMTMVSSTVGAVIISTIPLFVPLAAFLFFRDKISWLNLAGITISFTGVLLVIVGKGFRLIAPAEGIALIFLAVFSAVAHSVIIVKLINQYRSLTIVLAQSIMGVIYFLPLFLIFELESFKAIEWNWIAIEPVIKLAILPSCLSYVFFARTIKSLGVTRANAFVNFIPVFTALFSYLILGETMTAGKIAGIILVLAGLFTTQVNPDFFKAIYSKRIRFDNE